jgi:hypothetical protein
MSLQHNLTCVLLIFLAHICVVWSLDCEAMADTRFMEGKYIIGQQ